MWIRDKIAKTGAVLEGEYFFALASGRVSNKYINFDAVFAFPELVDEIGELLVAEVKEDFDVIAGPAVGAIPLIYAVARHYNAVGTRTVWADKKDGSFVFERMGFAKTVRKKRVLVVEDVTTTGASAKAVGKLVEQEGGRVIAYLSAWNRGVTAEKMGAPAYTLVNESAPSWAPGEHAMWGKWPLVEDIGHPEHITEYHGSRISLLI